MKRLLVLLAWLLSVLIVSGLVTVFSLYLLTRPSLRVVQTWKQPDDIRYDEGVYYLSVVAGDLDWRGFPFHVSRRYFVYVGRESGKPTYGHMVDFSFHAGVYDVEEHIRRSSVEWSNEGVTLQTVSGHRLFIPARMFVGGR